MNKVVYILIFSVCEALLSVAQAETMTREEYISQWWQVAIEQMRTHKIPASITLAQAILESGHGNSPLARLANNHFGIKCHEWKGETIYHDDDKPNECFRKYASANLSYDDHSLFLTTRKRYAKLFTLEITDYKQWAHGLKSAGYATNPRYAHALIELIENYQLHQYDYIALQEQELTSNSPIQQPKVIISYTPPNNSGKKDTTQELEINLNSERIVQTHENKVRYILARKDDSYKKIAKEYNLTLRQILKYNDVQDERTVIKKNDIIHIHPKKSKGNLLSKSYDIDLTIWEIAQKEGVQLKKLMERNHLTSSSPNHIIKKGTIILLR